MGGHHKPHHQNGGGGWGNNDGPGGVGGADNNWPSAQVCSQEIMGFFTKGSLMQVSLYSVQLNSLMK